MCLFPDFVAHMGTQSPKASEVKEMVPWLVGTLGWEGSPSRATGSAKHTAR